MANHAPSSPGPILGLALLLLGGCAQGVSQASADHDLRVADVELASGMPEAALSLMQPLAARKPGDDAALIRMGEANMALGRREAAETSFRQAMQRKPASKAAALGLARLHLATDAPAALVELRALARRAPRDVRVLTDLGIASDLTGHATEAQSLYRQAIAINPSDSAAQANLGLSLALSGHAREALAILGPMASGTDASPRIRQDYAVAATLAGQTHAARDALARDLSKAQAAAAVRAYAALQTAAR